MSVQTKVEPDVVLAAKTTTKIPKAINPAEIRNESTASILSSFPLRSGPEDRSIAMLLIHRLNFAVAAAFATMRAKRARAFKKVNQPFGFAFSPISATAANIVDPAIDRLFSVCWFDLNGGWVPVCGGCFARMLIGSRLLWGTGILREGGGPACDR
jgi:hypothetical protein